MTLTGFGRYEKGDPLLDPLLFESPRPLPSEALDVKLKPFAKSTFTVGCARHLARGSLTLQKRTGLFGADLFVLLRRDDLLAAIEARRADVMTAMDFAGRRFDSRRRILQKVMSTTIAATGDRFLILLNSHGKPHVGISECRTKLLP